MVHIFVRAGNLFSPSGMRKSGTQSIATSIVTEITGWTVESGVIDSNALVPGGTKAAATVTYAATVNNANGGFSSNIALYKNGTQVGSTTTANVPGQTNGYVISGSQTLSVLPTDRFKLYMWNQLYVELVVQAGSGTYVRIA